MKAFFGDKERLLFMFCLLCILAGVAEAKRDEWYQSCDSGECGYSGDRGNSKCRDNNENCPAFARQGECIANPVWMHENCKRSCGKCDIDDIEDDEDCKDLHSNCPQWAGEMECFVNPAYMSRACPKSCWLCANATDLEINDKLEKKQIDHIKRFANTDFGLWQSIPPDDPGNVVRTEVMKMGVYAKSLEKIGPGTMCNNRYHECVQWVFEKGCVEELEYMMTHCSLACQRCDIVEDFQRCNLQKKTNVNLYGDPKKILMNLFHNLEADNLLEDFVDEDEGIDGEWVMSLDHSAIWARPEASIKEILSTIAGLDWKEASSKDYVDADSDTAPARSGLLAVCDATCRSRHPSIASLHSQLAKILQVNSEYLMPLEFVHYQRGERFAAHHDYQLHDQWKHSGRRAISVFVSLQQPESGGAFGFPDLNWLLVEDPKVLVWPNISPRNPKVSLGRMASEQLPVVKGDMYGVYTWVKEFPYDDTNSCA